MATNTYMTWRLISHQSSLIFCSKLTKLTVADLQLKFKIESVDFAKMPPQ